MINKIEELRLIKEEYLKGKLHFFNIIRKDYPNCFLDVDKIKREIIIELYILLSSIPIHKTIRYKVYESNGNNNHWYDQDLYWRPPYDDFYKEHQSYGIGFITIGNTKLLEIKNDKLVFSIGNYQGNEELRTIDFSKLKNLHTDKVIEFMECLQEFLDLDKTISIEKNGITFSIDDNGFTKFKCANDDEYYCLENCIHLEDTGYGNNFRYNKNSHVNDIIQELNKESKESKPLANEINIKTIFEILAEINILREVSINQLNLLLAKVQSKNYAFKLIKQI